MLDQVFEEILALAPSYNTSGTPDMVQRQTLLRSAASTLQGWLPAITKGTTLEGLGLRVGAGGRQSQVAPVGWVRMYSPMHSPRSATGFYLVYLFSADGSGVYLSLNQGTSEFRSGKWRPVTDPSELASRALVGRSAIDRWDSELSARGWSDIDLGLAGIDVGSESKMRAHNYEQANVLAVPYLAGAVPADGDLLADLQAFAPLLGELYGLGAVPASSAGAPPPKSPAASKGQGRRLDKAANDAVEDRAMDLAWDLYEADGWKVENVCRSEPFDLRCTRDEEELHVEVKGTTGRGEHVTITRGEVKHAKSGAPTALVVVSGIALVYHDDGTRTASGGSPMIIDPWELQDDRLVPLQFEYSVTHHP